MKISHSIYKVTYARLPRRSRYIEGPAQNCSALAGPQGRQDEERQGPLVAEGLLASWW